MDLIKEAVLGGGVEARRLVIAKQPENPRIEFSGVRSSCSCWSGTGSVTFLAQEVVVGVANAERRATRMAGCERSRDHPEREPGRRAVGRGVRATHRGQSAYRDTAADH